MKEKYITALICLLAVLATASAGAAQTGKTVLLVSDNEADSAVADAIVNVKNLDVVTTPWGEFNDSVVAEIKAIDPSTLFIIGGPDAVPPEYDTALESYTPIRISGEDRYETAANVLRHFEKDFTGKGIVIAYGHDTKGIKKALKMAKGLGWFVLFVKTDDIPLTVEDAIEKVNAGDFEIFDSPNGKMEKIIKKLEKKRRKITLHSLNDSEKAERAFHQIEEAKEEIGEAEEEIAERNISNSTANKLLELANKHLDKAEDAYNNGSYGEAFGQAISAEHLAKNAEKLAKHPKKHLHLGGTKKDGKGDHDEEEFCGEIESLTCPNGETGEISLIGGSTFTLTGKTEYEHGIESCEDLSEGDLVEVEAKNKSGTLHAGEIKLEEECDDDDYDTTTTTTSTTTTTLESTTTTDSTTTTTSSTTTTLEPTTTTSSTTTSTTESTTSTTVM